MLDSGGLLFVKKVPDYISIKEFLLLGGIIAFPTDTVIGLGVNGLSCQAVKGLFDLKGREHKKPLYLLAYSVSQITHYVELIPEYAYALMEKYFPGPLTLILRSKEMLFTLPDKRGDTLGVRIPNHPGLLKLLSEIELPLLNTSANISGEAPLTTNIDIVEMFGSKVRYVDLEYNIDMKNVPSTVVDCTGLKPIVVRRGAIDL